MSKQSGTILRCILASYDCGRDRDSSENVDIDDDDNNESRGRTAENLDKGGKNMV